MPHHDWADAFAAATSIQAGYHDGYHFDCLTFDDSSDPLLGRADAFGNGPLHNGYNHQPGIVEAVSTSDWVPEDVYQIGYQDYQGNWRCSYSGCRSPSVFDRACDLRKHHNAHTKVVFCTQPECVSSSAGFASQKDYRRHMRSHQPSVRCQEPSCPRVFSRMDNMVS